MSDDEFRNERLYQQTMAVFRRMLSNGLITEDEYDEIDTRTARRYAPKYGSLLAKISLINPAE